jgi:hypothetical protein
LFWGCGGLGWGVIIAAVIAWVLHDVKIQQYSEHVPGVPYFEYVPKEHSLYVTGEHCLEYAPRVPDTTGSTQSTPAFLAPTPPRRGYLMLLGSYGWELVVRKLREILVGRY